MNLGQFIGYSAGREQLYFPVPLLETTAYIVQTAHAHCAHRFTLEKRQCSNRCFERKREHVYVNLAELNSQTEFNGCTSVHPKRWRGILF